jgi:hypothetical protein
VPTRTVVAMTKRDMAEEFRAIERQAMGSVPPPRRVEVGSAESAFDNPPARTKHLSECGISMNLTTNCTCDDYSPEWT